jgi:hypothetical protein
MLYPSEELSQFGVQHAQWTVNGIQNENTDCNYSAPDGSQIKQMLE